MADDMWPSGNNGPTVVADKGTLFAVSKQMFLQTVAKENASNAQVCAGT